jgi:phage baseplate assembly protein W
VLPVPLNKWSVYSQHVANIQRCYSPNFTLLSALNNILSPVWTLSLDGGGAIAEGLDAIKQCLNVIVRTTKGTDPLRPEFGCDLYAYADQPLNTAIPNMKLAMLDAVAMWEPRIKITSIVHSLGDTDKGQINFNLGYSLSDSSISDSLMVAVNSGGLVTGPTRQRMILRAFFPVNGTGLQFQISGQLNGEDILPISPVSGFVSISDLYAWVQQNWTNYGQWYLSGDSLVGYMNPSNTSGSISVSLLSVRQIAGAIPTGFNYTITVNVDGVLYSNVNACNTPGDVLQYVVTDPVLGALGTWQLSTLPDSFNDDFSEDYDTYTQALQLITGVGENIQISITAD